MPKLLHETLKVRAEREEAYGPPIEDFSRAIGMFNALFAKKLKEPFTIADWPKIHIIAKLSRSMEGYRRDHPRDIAGYADCWATVIEGEEVDVEGGSLPPGVVAVHGESTGQVPPPSDHPYVSSFGCFSCRSGVRFEDHSDNECCK